MSMKCDGGEATPMCIACLVALCSVVFMGRQLRGVVSAETLWPPKPKLFTVWPVTGEARGHLNWTTGSRVPQLANKVVTDP